MCCGRGICRVMETRLCFDSKLVVVVVVIGLMETRLKHHCKHVSDSVPNSFDAREHFDYNIASLTGIAINCSVSLSCNDRS